jgi:hypothetical protein
MKMIKHSFKNPPFKQVMKEIYEAVKPKEAVNFEKT